MFLWIMTLFLGWTDSFNLTLCDIKTAKGQLHVAVYDQKSAFLNVSKAYLTQTFPITQTGKQSFMLPKLAPGNYAICCFQDLNGNNQLDTNFFGVPTEPFGFSKNAHSKFRAPYWEEVCLSVTKDCKSVEIQIASW
jgi:uncharacterized protein (DUF2141 family)